MIFATNYNDILNQIDNIDPVKYGKSRNYTNGAVTKLSPYISRGLISTKQVANTLLNKGYKPFEIYTFIKELTWRDYFQQVWIAKGNEIDFDLKKAQDKVSNHKIPLSIIENKTGIEAIENATKELYNTGYLHNHLRMYIASICCNIGQCHWHAPAQWMYYHLLDADWASNALSWQWVAGSFSNKKYYANQENINKYCQTNQQHTFLDVPYDKIDSINVPDILSTIIAPNLKTNLPNSDTIDIHSNKPFCVYSFYNLDCKWMEEVDANRILLLEPSFFKKYPVSDQTIDFILALSENISNIKVVVGDYEDIFRDVDRQEIHFKEHPTNKHYNGIEHSRDWLFEDIKGYYPSFSAYWKKCEKYLNRLSIS